MKIVGRMLSLIVVVAIVFFVWSHRSNDAPATIARPTAISTFPLPTTTPILTAPVGRGAATLSPTLLPSPTAGLVVSPVAVAIPQSRQLARNE